MGSYNFSLSPQLSAKFDIFGVDLDREDNGDERLLTTLFGLKPKEFEELCDSYEFPADLKKQARDYYNGLFIQ